MDERLAFGYGSSGNKGATSARSSGPDDGARPDSRRPAEPSLEEPPRTRRSAARTDDKPDVAFMGLMLFTALLFFRPQDQIRALGHLHLAELSAVGALIAMVTGRISRGLSFSRLTPELGGVVLMGAIILFTVPFSVWPGGSLGMFTEIYSKIILIFILIVNTLTSRKRLEQFVWLIVIASGYIAFRAVIDAGRGINMVENGRVMGAVGGMFRNPNDLALNMVAVMPLAASLALRSVSLLRRAAAVLCAVLMVGAIVASQSRSGTIGLLVMAVI